MLSNLSRPGSLVLAMAPVKMRRVCSCGNKSRGISLEVVVRVSYIFAEQQHTDLASMEPV